MAGFNIDPNISLGIKPQPVISIGDMLNIARGAQAYKQAEQINPLAVEEQRAVTQQQQTAAQKATRALEPELARIGAESQKSVMSAEQAGVDLKQHYSNVARGILGGFVTDPDFVNGNSEAMTAKINGAKDYAKNVLKLPEDVLKSSDQLLELAKTNPKQAYQAIKNGVTQAQAPTTQQSLITPNLGTNIYGQYVGVNPATGEEGTIAGGNPNVNPRNPAGVMSHDLYGNPVFVPYTPSGQIGAPQSIGGDNKAQPTMNLPEGETKESLNVVTGDRNKVNAAARQVPVQQFNANQIIKLADITDTGAGAEMLRNLGGGYAALPWTNDNATNYDKLGHYIAANSISLAQQAGLSTDAGRSLQEQASGSTRFTKDSLKSVARTNRALSSGVELLNRGLENAVTSSGNPFAARTFQNQWAQTVDVNALRLYDGLKNNDQQAIRDVVKEVGGKEGIKSKAYKDLLARMGRMKQLIQGQQ